MVDALTARKTWRTLEPIHGSIYFAPEAEPIYAALGVTGRSGYFASRAAPMGTFVADVVIATFHNFRPALVRDAMAGLPPTLTPAAMVDARLRAVDACLRDTLDSEVASPALSEAADLARVCALRAAELSDGRPLAAGHASLDWPSEPHLALWHAQSILREFRGDGHVALLVAHGLRGIDALVVHAATGEIPRAILQSTRAWTDDEWAAAVDDLATRGWVDGTGAFTDDGRTRRAAIETGTDELARQPYDAIGEDGCARLRELARPFSKAIVASGRLGAMSRPRSS